MSLVTYQRTRELYCVSYFDVSLGKLHFDGESSVIRFLEKLEELHISRNVSYEQLLRLAAVLVQNTNISDMEKLDRKLKESFQRYNYEYDLGKV